MSEESVTPCPQCQVGILRTKRMAYVRIINGLFVSVPDMPTQTCDICDYQEFGSEALLVLESLANRPGAESRTSRPTPRATPTEPGRTRPLKP